MFSAWAYLGAPPDFTISLTPTTATMLAGGSASYQVTVTKLYGFNGGVTLSASSLPAGATASLSGSGPYTLTITTALGTMAANCAFSVTGTSGPLAHTASSSMSVQDFGLTLSPSGVALLTGNGSANYQVTATRLNVYNGDITMFWIGWTNVDPRCTSLDYFPNIPSGQTSMSFILGLHNCPQGAPYNFSIQGRAGGVMRSAAGSLAVTGGGGSGDFTVTVSQASQTVTAGGAPASYGLTINSFGGFGATVNFSVSGVPSGANANTPASVYGAGSSTLTVNVPAGTAAGSFPLTITAASTSPNLSHVVTPMLIVQGAGGGLPANLIPPSPGIPQVPGVVTTLTAGDPGYQFQWDSGSSASEYSLTIEAADDQSVCTPSPYRGPLQPVSMVVSPSCCTRYRPMNAKLGSNISGAWQYQSYSGYACGTRGHVTGVSVSPSAGTGSSQTFTATYSDARGYSDIAQAQFLIQPSATSGSANQCVMRYDQSGNNLYLLADDGVTYLGPIAGGGYDTLANSQCAVTGGYNLVASGNTLSVNFSVIFTTGFAGPKQLFLNGMDGLGAPGASINVGSWTVPVLDTGSGVTSGTPMPVDPPVPAPTLTPPQAVSSGLVPLCSDASGTWNDPTPQGETATWTLSQTGNTISGVLTTRSNCTPPGGTVWHISPPGRIDGNIATFSATGPNPAIDICGVPSANPINVQLTVGCQTAVASENWTIPTNPPVYDSDTRTWTRPSPPAITLISDVTNDLITVTLAGQYKSAPLTVTAHGQQSAQLGEVTAGPGTYTFNLLNSTPGSSYDSISATWDNGTNIATAATPYKFLGLTRFSQYNAPDENDSSCTSAPSQAYVFRNDGTCGYDGLPLKTLFIRQTNRNGSSHRSNGDLVKPYRTLNFGCALQPGMVVTPPNAPGGLNDNTFVKLAPGFMIKGTCGTAFVRTDGSTTAIATNPNPFTDSTGTWNCNDQVLLVTANGAKDAIKTVQDLCPSCTGGFGLPYYDSTVYHIDSYTTSGSCTAVDYGNRYAIRLR